MVKKRCLKRFDIELEKEEWKLVGKIKVEDIIFIESILEWEIYGIYLFIS